MKKFLLFLMLFSGLACQAQVELPKTAKKALKKEIKKLTKEGWTVLPGALPLEIQLERSYQKQFEVGANGENKYIVGQAQSVGGNHSAAELTAMQIAKEEIAQQASSNIASRTDLSIVGEQVSSEEATALTQMAMKSTSEIARHLNNIRPIFKAYRKLSNSNVEVVVHLSYPTSEVTKAVLEGVRDKMQAGSFDGGADKALRKLQRKLDAEK